MQLLIKSILLWLALAVIATTSAHALQPQNCVGKKISNGCELHLQLAAQAAASQQENRDGYDETASDTCKDPTGFYYMGARYYDPSSGRFLSADPLGHAASMDLYSYANGDPVNGLDPDGRFGRGARVESDSGNNAFSSLAGMPMEAAQEPSLGGLFGTGINTDDYLPAGTDPAANMAAWSLIANMTPVLGGAKMLTEASTGQDLFTQTPLSADQRFSSAMLAPMGLLPIPEDAAVEAAADAAPQIFYRGDQAGMTSFQSYAARQGGIENSEAVLANGDLTKLMESHAYDSANPASPFISVTTDPAVARTFAGPGGTVYQLQLAPGRAILNTQNPLSESEWLVPHQISPSEINGTVP